MIVDGLSRSGTKAWRLQTACLEVIREHEAAGALPTSARFIWYELVQRQVVRKDQARGHPGVTGRGVDQDVGEAITHLREQGIIPWGWITDETRTMHSYLGWPSVWEGTRAAIGGVHLDCWGEEEAPILLTESRSLAGTLYATARTYRCQIAATNGQVGGFLHTAVAPELSDGQRVLYLGDLDLSGGQIEANTRRVLSEYVTLEWERLALTDQQADDYDLRGLAVLKRDRRYRDGHPHLAIETEALQQQVIVSIVQARLEELLPEPLDDVQVRERAQRAAVAAMLRGEA